MAEIDAGVLPVGENDQLVGMITVMSKEVLYCFDDQDLDDVARNMSEAKVRRLPVVNRDKRLVGIISLADLAKGENAATTGQAVADISAAGGAHSQSGSKKKHR